VSDSPAPVPPRTAEEEFEAVRPRLFGLAYRMTASVADAEDICQDAWLRWQRVDHTGVRSAEAYLVTLTTRLAMDRLRSAHRRREAYVGPWLPEPIPAHAVPATGSDGPEARAELADSLTFGFLTLLDELSPVERAVLLLHDVFGHGFTDTAAAVGISPEAARKAASRARAKVRRPGDSVSTATAADRDAATRERLGELTTALLTGDADAVLTLLAPGVVQLDDGGPARRAARRPVVGPERVTRLLLNVTKRLVATGPEAEAVDVNGGPGILMRVGGRATGVMTIALDADGLIDRIWVQLNPDKLEHL